MLGNANLLKKGKGSASREFFPKTCGKTPKKRQDVRECLFKKPKAAKATTNQDRGGRKMEEGRKVKAMLWRRKGELSSP